MRASGQVSITVPPHASAQRWGERSVGTLPCTSRSPGATFPIQPNRRVSVLTNKCPRLRGLRLFDKISQDVPSFGALPREAWMILGILELVCTVGLIVPAAFHWQPRLTILAATLLAVESLVFVGAHVKYREITPMILSGVLGLLMAFIAYGRVVLKPIF
ncbi:MAG: DoxX family protein [Steroidobacteraceae bacterium]